MAFVGVVAFGVVGFGDEGFGDEGFGDEAFGDEALGVDAFGDAGLGVEAFGDDAFGDAGFGDDAFGDDAFGDDAFGDDGSGVGYVGVVAAGSADGKTSAIVVPSVNPANLAEFIVVSRVWSGVRLPPARGEPRASRRADPTTKVSPKDAPRRMPRMSHATSRTSSPPPGMASPAPPSRPRTRAT
jgi:hypothetical protein